jgi:ComF family protein
LISESSICITCRERNYRFAANTSAFEYRDSAKELLAALKFDNRRRVAMIMADFLAPLLLRRGLPVVPVPARKAALRARGWDPVWEICRFLGRRHGLQVVRCLQRIGGAPQKALDFEARRRNVAGQIRATRPPVSRMVLLDDVFTTGATLDECAGVLRQAGSAEVYAVTFAID